MVYFFLVTTVLIIYNRINSNVGVMRGVTFGPLSYSYRNILCSILIRSGSGEEYFDIFPDCKTCKCADLNITNKDRISEEMQC